jgi:organic hydroperoxide reductase OsmC/OhrA
MTPLPHRYRVELRGGAAEYAALTADGRPELRTASPPEYGGPGDAWTPEHLLLASVESCFLFTLRAVAARAAIAIEAVHIVASGTVDRQDGAVRFTDIVLHVELTVGPSMDGALIRQIVDKSERACLVAASLTTPVHVELAIRPS